MDVIWTHKDLEAWQRALTLAERIYQATKLFPDEERYGLSSQMRRAAVSIASNIAEGAARKSRQEFLQFLHIARGSLSELDTQVTLAIRLGYIAAGNGLEDNVQRVGRLLTGLISKLRNS